MDPLLVTRIVLSVTFLGSGVLMWWMARAAASGRLKRNDMAGIRIPSTMASDEAWLAAHQRAEQPNLWSGYVALACAVLVAFPLSMGIVLVVTFLGCSAILGLVLYGVRVGGEAANAVTAESDSHGDA